MTRHSEAGGKRLAVGLGDDQAEDFVGEWSLKSLLDGHHVVISGGFLPCQGMKVDMSSKTLTNLASGSSSFAPLMMTTAPWVMPLNPVLDAAAEMLIVQLERRQAMPE